HPDGARDSIVRTACRARSGRQVVADLHAGWDTELLERAVLQNGFRVRGRRAALPARRRRTYAEWITGEQTRGESDA
ncbi:MAG: hypothetical protein ACRELT_09315, partial [Longimicrobiales bacterium]